ncbi:MAG: glycosyltransferase [Clostridia bacterium]|nr:glycosyltransferase [Clostridia bacterium]MDD4386498.1 glycosyltransferase [Clostridia bacterium]
MQETIRVLHVLRSMNCGGIENFIMNLYRNIDKQKIQFDFLVNDSGVFDEEIKKMGGLVYIMPHVTKVGHFKYVNLLDNFFKNHKEYKIIHSHINQISGIILERVKKCGIPVRISHSHISSSPKGTIQKIYKNYLGGKIYKNATNLLACSDLAAKWLFKKHFNDAQIIPNCIEIDRFKYSKTIDEEIRNLFKIERDTFVIGHVGRFCLQKNHDFLIEIFYEIQKQKENSRLILCGDGSLKLKITRKINELGIEDKVILIGVRKDINKIYSVFNTIVFPSFFEGLPLTLIEGQINGLNIFCSNTISQQVNISKKVEFISLKKSSLCWANAILSSNCEREDYIDKIIKAGYDAKTSAYKIQEFYIKTLNNK